MSDLRILSERELDERDIRARRTIAGNLRELDLIFEERLRRKAEISGRIKAESATPVPGAADLK